MAINFPSTAGQPTNGSYTYTVAGISYSWNGESWVAAGAGASATDRTLFSVSTNAASATPALSYNSNSGVFSYTPPNLSPYLTAESDTLQSVINRGNTVTGTDINFGEYTANAPKITYDDSDDLLWFKCLSAGSSSSKIWLGNGISFNNLSIQQTQTQSQFISYNSDLFLSTQSAGKNIELQSGNDILLTNSSYPAIKVLENGVTNGAALSVELYWGSTNSVLPGGGSGGKRLETTSTGVTVTGTVDATAFVGDGTGLTNVTSGAARTTVAATNSIAANGIANISMTTPKTYALLSIETSHAAWVTLYSDAASRTADSSRNETTDPVAGSGVLAEVITSGSTTQLITPASVCFNSAGANTTYLKIVNKSGGTANVQVTLTFVPMET